MSEKKRKKGTKTSQECRLDSTNDALDARRSEPPSRLSLDVVLAIFWGAFLLFFWGWRYRDFLFAAQENSLFLTRIDFLLDWLREPAGALGYATAFVMQFGSCPLLLALLLAALGVGLQVQISRAFRLPGLACVLTVLPTLALAVSATWNAYYVYNSAYVTLVFSGYVGANLALFAATISRRATRSTLGTLVVCLCGAVGYAYFGAWACLALTIVALDATSESRRLARVRAGVLLSVAALAPYVIYRYFFFDTLPANGVWTLGLFDPMIDRSDEIARNHVVYGAVTAPVFILGFAICRCICDCRTTRDAARKNSRKDDATPTKKRDLISKRRLRLGVEFSLVLACALLAFSYREAPFFEILAQNRALTCGDWNAVLRIDERVRRPIGYSVALRNVALFELGELGERAFERPIAGLNTTPFTSEELERIMKRDPDALKKLEAFQKRRITQRAASVSAHEIILCRYGLANLALRSAMNKRAVCRGRSAATLKILLYCALISGERDLAERYLRELRDAPNQRAFVRLCDAFLETRESELDLRDMINDSDQATLKRAQIDALLDERKNVDLRDVARRRGVKTEQLERFTRDLLAARRARPVVNVKRVVAAPDLARLYGVFNDPYDVANPRIREAELVAALFQKGSLKTPGDNFFMEHIESYARDLARPLPKALEQGYATFRFERLGANWSQGEYRFSEETKREFGEYAEFYREINGAVTSRAAQDGVREFCRGTYWGYVKDDSAFIQF